MRLFMSFLLVVFGFISSFGQINTFKILVKSGESQVRIGEVVTTLEKGMVLSGEFTLIINDESYLGLVHNSGNVLEVKESGSYTASELYDLVTSKETNTIVTTYTDFILNRQFQERQDEAMSEAVRAFEPFAASEVNLYIPNATELYGDKLALEWSNESDFSVIQVMNMFEEVLMEEKVEGHRHMLNLATDNLKNEEILMVKVYQENDMESKAIALKRIGQEAKSKHAQNLEALTNDISNNALLELIKAAYFEDNRLLADAFTSYVNAMLLEPEVEDYRLAYKEFLVRHKLMKLSQ